MPLAWCQHPEIPAGCLTAAGQGWDCGSGDAKRPAKNLNAPLLLDRCFPVALKEQVCSRVLRICFADVGHLQDVCKTRMEAHQEAKVLLRLRPGFMKAEFAAGRSKKITFPCNLTAHSCL